MKESTSLISERLSFGLLGSAYDHNKTEMETANSVGCFQVYGDGLTKW